MTNQTNRTLIWSAGQVQILIKIFADGVQQIQMMWYSPRKVCSVSSFNPKWIDFKQNFKYNT